MSRTEPMAYQWREGVMIPLRTRAAAQMFEENSIHWLVEQKAVTISGRSKRHLFAIVGTTWENLSEDQKDYYPDPEFLRKRLMIKTGFYDEEIFGGLSSASSAGQLATSMKRLDRFSVVITRADCVLRRTAQSIIDMEPETFQRMKEAVIGELAEMLGVTVDELTKQGE